MPDSNTTIAIRYESLSRAGGLKILAIWAVAGVLLLWLWHGWSLAVVGGLGYVALFFVAATVFCYVAFVISSAVVEGSRLLLSEEGISLPGGIPGFGGARWSAWKDLKKIECRSDSNGSVIRLRFSRFSFDLRSTKVSEADLERILLGVDVWARNAVWEPSAISLRDSLQNKARGIETNSYTAIWQQELARHFNSTVFVPLEPGQKVRDQSLQIIRQIAFGGFSAVYLAEGESGKVVLKESVPPIDAPEAVRLKATELFSREAKILMRLRHPHIAKVLDHFVENDRSYIVLEYVPGQNLRQVVAWRGPLEQSVVANLTKQMAEVLNYLHTQNPPVVHRDFTPDNLVLKDDGELVLVDFGAANEFVGTATGTLVGKQCYMAPEQIKGKAGPYSDMYSMGATLYFLLTGKDPEAIAVSHLEPSKLISASMSGLVAQLTSLNWQDRPGAADLISR